ncbi:MAG: transposase, partial [Nitrososphaeria archaeon]
ALTLANLLRGGYIPECYIPDMDIQQLRELVRYRARLVKIRTMIKNSIHSILLMYNIRLVGYPFTEKFNEELRSTGDPKINGYLNILKALDAEIDYASKTIEKEAKENEDVKLLMTVPGISYYSALLISSEIGDISRFPDSSHLVSYAGLAPSTRSSGGKTHYGPITKQG